MAGFKCGGCEGARHACVLRAHVVVLEALIKEDACMCGRVLELRCRGG